MVSSSSNKNFTVENVVISQECAGQRLDNFLIAYCKGVPKTRIYRIIRKGEVRINRGRIKPDYRLISGDLLRIPPLRQAEKKSVMTFSGSLKTARHLLDCILYEDEELIVINKPAGVAVHGGSGISFGVIEALRHVRGNAAGNLELIHRLDRDTSGCLMIAKQRNTLKAIHKMLRMGEVQKIYWVLVKGNWQKDTVIKAPLKKNLLSSGERMVKVATDGQLSTTEFRVLMRYANRVTLMEAKPKTGRTHQIRVHAAHTEHPIVGDPKYGDNTFNRVMKAAGFKRLFLHAREIILRLPKTQKMVSIEAPLDQQWQMCLSKLEKGEIYV
jgi:23S rRNA pseudouridine955/2504/2580 synthase